MYPGIVVRIDQMAFGMDPYFYVEVYHLFEEADTGIYRISAGTRLASEQVTSMKTDAKTQAVLRLFLPLVAR